MSQKKLIIFDLDGTLVNSQALRENILASEPLFDNVLEMLHELNKRPEFLLAIATGKSMDGTKRTLQAHKIIDYFSSLQTPDNNFSKPNPEMIYSAISVADVAKENTIMIGDTILDIRMAKSAKVKSIAVGWGYQSKQDLLQAGATSYVEQLGDLINTIDRHL